MSSAPRVLLLFPSIHHVLAAEQALQGAGVVPDLVPVPKEISPLCGMAIAVAPSERPRALHTLAENPPARILDDWQA
jgi:hypothetical protein